MSPALAVEPFEELDVVFVAAGDHVRLQFALAGHNLSDSLRHPAFITSLGK